VNGARRPPGSRPVDPGADRRPSPASVSSETKHDDLRTTSATNHAYPLPIMKAAINVYIGLAVNESVNETFTVTDRWCSQATQWSRSVTPMQWRQARQRTFNPLALRSVFANTFDSARVAETVDEWVAACS